MKLASEYSSSADGRLLVVSRDLQRVADASSIAPNLQAALEHWAKVEGPLQDLYEQLNRDACADARSYGDIHFAAPLPRAWQWLDGSAFPMHGELMSKAFNQPPIDNQYPLMYQGMSHRFYGPNDEVPFVDEAGGIDFEGEFGVITGPVAMGSTPAEAQAAIRLLVQINDWSLRTYAVPEMKTGFGWILAKPACSMAPLALTPDELGACWQDSRVTATLQVQRGEETFGAVPGNEMGENFATLIAHAAGTRELCAGTLVGSGTVSHSDYRSLGSTCIAERRAIEMIDHGQPKSAYLHFGESVRMRVFGTDPALPLFGELDQQVVRAEAR